jgi:hypothetical protein
MRYLSNIAVVIFISFCCHAQGKGKGDTTPSTNAVPAKVEKQKEKKIEHQSNKLIIKARDKGSKKESDWKTSKEYPLMFKNNKKAKTVK